MQESAQKEDQEPQQEKTDPSVELFRVIKQMVFFEKEDQNAKETLSLCLDFSLNDAFRELDSDQSGALSTANMIEGVNRLLGFSPQEDEVELLMKRYGRRGERKLSYNDFCEMLTPSNPLYAGRLRQNAPSAGQVKIKVS